MLQGGNVERLPNYGIDQGEMYFFKKILYCVLNHLLLSMRILSSFAYPKLTNVSNKIVLWISPN